MVINRGRDDLQVAFHTSICKIRGRGKGERRKGGRRLSSGPGNMWLVITAGVYFCLYCLRPVKSGGGSESRVISHCDYVSGFSDSSKAGLIGFREIYD